MRWRSRAISALIVLASLLLIVPGSRWLVQLAVTLARWLRLSEFVIGPTIVALSTSLPEVGTAVMAACRGERDIAVGNVIGSNIFDLLGVLGLAAALAPGGVTVDPAILAFDLPVMMAVAVLGLPIFFSARIVFRWEGVMLLSCFVIYTAYIVLRATEHDALTEFTSVVAWVVIPVTVFTLAAVALGNMLRRVAVEKKAP